MCSTLNSRNLGVFNVAEIIVSSLLNKILEDYKDICKCEKCINDMLALSLNNVKPHYVTSDSGAVYAKVAFQVNPQELATLTCTVMQAIEKVSSNPHH